jgi:tetratricopeptide (TPR) repeat protein
MKNYDAAIADFNTVIKDSPDFPDAYILRGDAYGAKGVYHSAAADYKTSLEKGYDPGGFTVDKSSKADMWFCGAMFMEITVNRFLGKPDVVAKYEDRLKTVCDKNKLSRAEVEAFYRQNIGALVAALTLEKFSSIAFLLENYAINSYNATLSINPETKEYTLKYGGHAAFKEISARDLNALLVEMRNRSRDFDSMGIEQVETMANLIPAVVYAGWLRDGTARGVDAVSLAAKTIADYYLNPTQENYNLLVGVFGSFNRSRGINDPVADAGRKAYDNLLSDLNKNLRARVYDDNILRGAALAQTAQTRNSAYGVFAIPYVTGGRAVPGK